MEQKDDICYKIEENGKQKTIGRNQVLANSAYFEKIMEYWLEEISCKYLDNQPHENI